MAMIDRVTKTELMTGTDCLIGDVTGASSKLVNESASRAADKSRENTRWGIVRVNTYKESAKCEKFQNASKLPAFIKPEPTSTIIVGNSDVIFHYNQK